MKLLSIALLVCIFGFVCSQTRPKLPSTFTSTVSVVLKTRDGGRTGTGYWDADQTNNYAVRNSQFSDKTFTIALDRYDLKRVYRINSSTTCDYHDVEGDLPDMWEWVADAEYSGKRTIKGVVLDIWEYSKGPGTLTLGVAENDPNTPKYMGYFGNQISEELMFDSFNTSVPAASVFTVPRICYNNQKHNNATHKVRSPAACASSSEIMKRAEVWVEHKVPYNQGADYMGYREDCSGYVSYSWDSSKPGHTTYTMHEIAHKITKAELRDGDCLLWAADHVVLFGGWADSAKSKYWAYEETKPGTGTIKSVAPYPFFYSKSDFIPFRFNDKCT